MGGIKSATAPTGDVENEITFPLAFVFFLIFVSYCYFPSRPSYVFSSSILHTSLLWTACPLKRRNNHFSSKRIGKLDLLVFKENMKVSSRCSILKLESTVFFFLSFIFLLTCARISV